jgi:hypothetical protein
VTWEHIDELAKNDDQGGGAWLRLANDGDKAVVLFAGDPLPRRVCFLDGKYLNATAELEAKGVKVSTRVATNVVVLPGFEVKAFEMSLGQRGGLYPQVRELRKKYGFGDWAFEIVRRGTGLDTTYSALPERQLTADEKRKVAGLQLKDLAKLYGERDGGGGKASSPGGGGGGGGFDEVIDDEVAAALMAGLKELPKEAVERFCERFGVQRIRQVPKNLGGKARAFVDQMRSEYLSTASKPTERDPFA